MTPDEVRAIVSSREFQRLHNAIRILGSLAGETDLGVSLSEKKRDLLRRSPGDVFILCDDATAAALWQAIEARQPAELRVIAPEQPAELKQPAAPKGGATPKSDDAFDAEHYRELAAELRRKDAALIRALLSTGLSVILSALDSAGREPKDAEEPSPGSNFYGMTWTRAPEAGETI